jgi:hypothetical protein
VGAVSRVVEAVFAEPDKEKEDEEEKGSATPLKGLPVDGTGKEWEPLRSVLPSQKSVVSC